MNALCKEVGYSYPSSSNATRFGFARTGCHTVSLWDKINPPKAVAAFATREQAVNHADTLPNDWVVFLGASLKPECP